MKKPIRISDNIILSKDSILNRYQNLDVYFRDCLEALYGKDNGVDIKCFLPCNIINNTGKNSALALNSLIGKAGIYIFLDQDLVPVYIGKGGTSSSTADDAKDLKFRINQQLGGGNRHNTLSNNIIEIESLLSNNTITEDESIEYIKSFSLLVISSGDRRKNGSLFQDSIDNANTLETILIALFHPKYNK